ncbi:MAG: hypothetical protein KatS3mg121_1372 [Gammaproteobacteria bacterium]|nr:MAG: hypothetical protein KatS3mg121_1372 [Gammaproteobacteria bacterium]
MIVTLHHDGEAWWVEVAGTRLAAAELDALDRLILEHLRRLPAERRPRSVVLRAGAGFLPRRLRQYADHYMERRLEPV